MRHILIIVAALFIISCSPQPDFKSSNWGDTREKVAKTYSEVFNSELSTDLLSFDQLILGKKATVHFNFTDSKLVSSFTLFETMSPEDTKMVYEALKKQNTDRFGEETFNSNPQKIEEVSINQIIWSDDETTVSMRLDEGRLIIKYFDFTFGST